MTPRRAGRPAAVKVLVVDDHEVVAQSIVQAMSSREGLAPVGYATSLATARERIASDAPDVVLLDVALGDGSGIDLASELRREAPDVAVVFLTGLSSRSVFAEAMRIGASGFLLKDTSLEELCAAVVKAAEGRVVVPGTMVGRLLHLPRPTRGPGYGLTGRERQVLALLGEGHDAKTIARTLGVTWSTARTYIQNVLVKMGARSQLEAVVIAAREGILQITQRAEER